MANIREKLEFIIETRGADKVLSELKAVKLGLKDAGDANKSLTNGTNLELTGANTKSLQKMAQDAKKASFWTREFRMEFLGIMFAGMQLQRTFGNMFKDLIKNFRDLSGASNPLNKSMTQLEANFKFLKFQIIEAMGPMLARMVDGFSWLTETLARSDPKRLAAIGTSIAAIAAAGTAMFLVGQIGIGANAFMQFFANVANGSYGSKLKTLSTNLGSVENKWSKLAGAAVIGLSIKDFIEGQEAFESGDWANGLFQSLSAGLKAAGGYGLMKNKKGAGWLVALGFAFDLAAEDKLGSTLGSFIGFISGLGVGIGNAVAVMAAKLTQGFSKAFEGAPGMLRVMMGLAWDHERTVELAGKSVSEAFMEGFESGFQIPYEKGRDFDKWFAEIKENAKTQSEFASDPEKISSFSALADAVGADSPLNRGLSNLDNTLGVTLPASMATSNSEFNLANSLLNDMLPIVNTSLPAGFNKTEASVKTARDEVKLIIDGLSQIPSSITTTHTIIRKIITKISNSDDDDKARAAVQAQTGSRGAQPATGGVFN